MANLTPGQKSQRTKQIAYLVMFTALYVILRFIPFTIIIGPSGGFLSLSDFLAPIIGILLGPYLGGLSVIIGNFAAIGLGRPMIFFGLDFIPDLMGVLATGFLIQQKKSRWAIAVGINAALLAIFLVNPLTSFFVFNFPFVWLHIVAFILLLTPLSWYAAKWVDTFNIGKITLGVILISFIAVMVQHLAGNILYEVVLGQLTSSIPASAYPATWSAVFFVYPVERAILVTSATIVGAPLLYLVNRVPYLNPRKQLSPKQTPPQQPIE